MYTHKHRLETCYSAAECHAQIIQRIVGYDGIACIMYGICIYHTNGGSEFFRDITDDSTTIKKLYALISEKDIDEKHIGYIIEDFVDELHCV